MRYPTLAELPIPPSNKTGWPWTEENPQLLENMPNGSTWPRISIVTPSYNQEQFIEETIRSVLLQGYLNLEYIIIDGGSTDRSVDIIRKYEPWLAYWVSETDWGQSHALNKGFARATGEIYAWLNSDDVYRPEALHLVARRLIQRPATGMVYGHSRVIDPQGTLINTWVAPEFDLKELLFQYQYISQPSAFFRYTAFQQVSGIDESFYYTMDYDLWLRLGKAFPVERIPYILSDYREHGASKTVSNRYGNRSEILRSLQRFFADPAPPVELRQWEPMTYGIIYLHQALAAFQENVEETGRASLKKALDSHAEFTQVCQERILRLLMAYAPAPYEQTTTYFQIIRRNLPPSAYQFRKLLILAQNRILILKVMQSYDLKQRRQALPHLRFALRHDLAWFKDKQVILGAISLLGGQPVLGILASLKRSLLSSIHSLKMRETER